MADAKAKARFSRRGAPLGESNGQAKLTWEIVARIRAEYRYGPKHDPNRVSYSMLAERYGVTRIAIKNIIVKITWVPPGEQRAERYGARGRRKRELDLNEAGRAR